MTREKMIKEMKGNSIIVNAEWLEENDPEMLEWITTSKYWGRGYEQRIDRNEAIVELYFDEGGVSYKATFEGHSQKVRTSLNNQDIWGEDEWDDWDDEQLELYYQKTNQ